ncbi:Ig-like domain-containing protein [Mucilaginibacter gotjawali]|uniref:Gliding motility-associated-like protein n=1 Tax=Mucilaginibacter gotjawali TaxID=1550579 RepID=A0A839SHL8_9SPHI|nr:PKD-like domain-containing protein [Mucilaginibacter gotjawali]MBB3056793.1 gliding motility-associated-like protein [Mucilaginibacter gotjawali]
MKIRVLLYLFLLLGIKGYAQPCTLNVSINQSAPSICSGYNVTLTATTSGGTAPFTYIWNTGETTSSIAVNKAGTYTVTVSDKSAGCPPVKKSITIAVTTTPNAPTASGVTVCANTPAVLKATAPGGNYQWYDAPSGGNFLASGATFTTPPINATTVFFVETTIGGCTSPRTAVGVSLPVKPVAAGVQVCAGNAAILTASGNGTLTWYNAPNGTPLATGTTFTTPALNINTTYYVTSTANGCESNPTSVTVTVTPVPQAPTAANVSVCSGSSANLHASANGGIFNWYNTPAGGTPLISSPDYTTPPLFVNTAYYVSTAINTCESPRVKVLVTVNSPPAPPISQTVNTCYQSSVTLTAKGSGAASFDWYDAPTGGNLLATGATFTTPVLSNSTTYYIEANNLGCISTRSAINVIVSPQVAAPTAGGAVICSGSTATLTATSQGGTYQWYSAAVAGKLLASGAGFTTPPLVNTTTYYVQNTIGGCVSPRVAVTVTVTPALAAPTAQATSICAGSPATLSASGSPGGYSWYDQAAGGNLLATTQAFVTPALAATTTYYVESTTATCTSARTAVKVTVNPSPVAPTLNPVSVCPGTPAILTATGATGTVKWYDAPAGGNLLASGNTYKTPALKANTTYYAESTLGQCTSQRVAVTVSITTLFDPQFQYSSGTFCSSGANQTPVINNPNGGVFSAAPAGLVFVSTATGEINVAGSVPGTYTVSFAGNGACAGVTSAKIVIGVALSASFSYNQPFCQFGVNPLPVSPVGSAGGSFSSSPAGLVFVNTSTGEIDLSKSAPGNYTITNTIVGFGAACPASSATFNVTINPSALVNAGPNQVVPSGSKVQLAGSIIGGITTGAWSGGTGSFSNPALPNAVYTPGPGETVARLTLTSTDPPGPCGPVSSSVTINFSPLPASPTVQSINDCAGSSATLSATAPGGTYQWYDAAVAGTLLSTGPNFTTPVLNANVTYYVQTTVNGVTSNRTAVTVTVNAVPAAPIAAPAQTCIGSGATLTASGSAGTYQWYDAAIGGNLLWNTNTYTTPALNAPASYFVQTTVNGCISARTRVDVTVTQVPNITSGGKGVICSGVPQNYTITSDVPTATFSWSRAAVPGISNPAVNNQVTSTIAETLINTSINAVNVTYVITPISGACSGPPLNYVVTVYPTPAVISPLTATVCDNNTAAYAVTFNVPVAAFSWSRAAVPGISNAAVSGQTATTIREVLFNITNAPIDVTYNFNFATATCPGAPTSMVMTVYPQAVVTSASAGIACTGSPQGYVLTSNIPSATFNWSRAAVAGISNPAVSNQTKSTIDETLINTTFSTIGVVYIITPIANGCPGTPFRYTVSVNPPLPVAVATSNSPVCIGSTIHLSTPPVNGATYLWTGPNGYTSTKQNPDITNVTNADAGVYSMTFTVKGCSSIPFPVVVNIDQLPVANAGPNQTVCIGSPVVSLNGSVTGGTTTGIWTTAGTGTFSKSDNLQAKYTPSAADKAAGSVVLTLTSTSKDNCTISTSPVTITFDSGPVISSSPTGGACTGVPQNYVITSNEPAATYSWSRAAVAGISNPAVNNQTGGTITESLINTTPNPVDVVYLITPTGNGCPGVPFKYTATVNPALPVVSVSSNTPVCVGSTITLTATPLPGATYAWTGPNGFTSADQNPNIANVTQSAAGAYSMVFTYKGCTSNPVQTVVTVNDAPVANAGPDQLVCIVAPNIILQGTITGGTGTGIWRTAGTGTFSPSATNLQAQYLPSAADKAAGSVVLTLASTSANCSVSSSSMTVSFGPLPAVNAGPDQDVCSQDANIPVAGTITIPGGGTWSSKGTGTFSAPGQLNTTYAPSAADIKNGSVTLVLTANNPGQCYIATDEMKINFIPPPTVFAGGTVYVLTGSTITLNPTVSDPNVKYQWSPNIDINDITLKNPVVTGTVDRRYTLTVTDIRGCIAQDTVFVKVAPILKINNTFTPNGDGINDYWEITGLIAYINATVDIFDRYGQKVFHSIGYPKAWDGTINGKPVPTGVYYYVINPHFDGQHVLSGYVTVLR